MASTAQPIAPAPRASEDIFLADELLEEIFLRLPTPADLARASTACASFRRVITGPSFLRRFRSLHPPPLVGFLYDGFHPAEPPHHSAPAARALAQAADFKLLFLPAPGLWTPRDARDGRVLVVRVVSHRRPRPRDGGAGSDEQDGVVVKNRNNVTTDLAVCDPLSRRYVLLPPIPDDLTEFGEQGRLVDFEPFLAPACEEEEEEEEEGTSFRVVARSRYQNKLVAFVFSSRTGQWGGVEFHGWSALDTGVRTMLGACVLCWPFYARGCFYWILDSMNKLLVLDMRRMEVSTVDLPQRQSQLSLYICFAILETKEGSLGIFTVREHSDGTSHLCYTIRRIKDEDANGWHLNLDFDKIIPLPVHYRYCIAGAAEGYLLLRGIPEGWCPFSLSKQPDAQYFSLELKTLQLERVCGLSSQIVHAELYTSFPPSLSLPCV